MRDSCSITTRGAGAGAFEYVLLIDGGSPGGSSACIEAKASTTC